MSKGGKQVQFIDEDGVMFVTSTNYMLGLMSGKSKCGFILLSRMPYKVAKNRWDPSPVYDPTGVLGANAQKTLSPSSAEEKVDTSNDSFSNKFKKTNEQRKAFTDKPVWD